MQLTPRYGPDPILTMDGSPSAVAEPAIRQRRRLAAALAEFTDEQWAHPTRCEGWSARDVVVHLDSTNAFFGFSVAMGVKGEPTEFLASFDPVASPAQLVAGASELSTREVLDRFLASTESIVGAWESLTDEEWAMTAEAPPGHLSVSAVVHHALWDSWIHERDILLPQGIAPAEEPDEIAAGLRYAAALSPGYAITNGHTDPGLLVIDATDPDLSITVAMSDHVAVRAFDPGTDSEPDLRIAGRAVELFEALSMRGPYPDPIPPEQAWMLSGLSEVFDQI